MPTGTVKWFDPRRGYGFITPDERGPDVFVHYTGIADGGFRSLEAGTAVHYDVREGRKGTEAFEVRASPAREPERHPGARRQAFRLRRGQTPAKERSPR